MAQEKLISLNNLSTFKDNVDILLNNKDSYGVCSTAANVAAKVVSHSTFVLTNGASISVKFENSNTAENPTLNVNNTGAKAIYRFGTTKPGTTEGTSWTAGSIVTLTYDGTNWVMNDVQESNAYKTISYAQWLEMTPAEREAEDYYIPDYPGASVTAGGVSYDNTTSGLTANNVQAAIDELSEGMGGTSDYDDLENKPQIGGVTLSGNKSASDLGLATSSVVQGILDGQSIDSFGDVETALSGKQNTLTAGDYINIINNEIEVNREIPNESFTYKIDYISSDNFKISKLVGGVVVFEQTYTYTDTIPENFDNAIKVWSEARWYWYYELLIDSTTHEAGFKQKWSFGDNIHYTEQFDTVDNTGRKLIIKSEMDTALASKVNTSAVGAASGIAELDANGKVPSSQLPSYVDDTIEGYLYDGRWYSDSSHTTEVAGETGKIYIDLDTNKTYRWSGSTFVEISESLALGETSSTAYRGDRGKTAYDHASDSNKSTIAQSSGFYKFATTSEGHIASVTAVQKSDITELGIPSDFEGTTAEWNALTTDQQKSYDRALITDDYDLPDHMEAYEIIYNNTSSGLSSTNVQDAIDEVNGKVITSDATTSVHGLMSASDKSKLNGIAPGATANTGTVTSVGITAVAGSGIGVSGSPITSSGSIALTNNGVRSISGGNARGAIKVNTGGSYSEVNLTGVYFGIDEQRDPTEWPTPTINDTGTIHVYTTTPIQPDWYAGDRLILFLYNQYQNTTDSQQQSYELLLSFNNDSQTTYPVYYMGEDGNIRLVVFDAAKTIKLVPGKAYTLTFTRDYLNGDFFIIDDLFISPTAFIGTTTQWNALDTTGNKTLYDVAYITND